MSPEHRDLRATPASPRAGPHPLGRAAPGPNDPGSRDG